MKPKRCKVCKTTFQPFKPLQVTCGWECAHNYAVKQRENKEAEAAKAERKEIRQRKEAAKPLSYWADRAQAAVNAYRREVFKDEPCISCGRHHAGQYHAGHYINRGSHPELRFVELNIWKQCKPCNVDLSGNKIEMRKALVARIGETLVQWLEGPHPQAKYTKADFQRIEAEYKQKLKDIQANPSLAELALAYPERYGEFA